MAKPTGRIGPIRISTNSRGEITSSVTRIPFSEDKDEIEKYIVDRFIYSANKALEENGEQFIMSSPSKNKMDDFDFDVETTRGRAYLELMEAAPLERINGGYNNASPWCKSYEYAKELFDKIIDKSNKYPKKLDRALFLLLYVTHWTFVLNKVVITYLRYFCSKNPPRFNAVFSYVPTDAEIGETRWIYPVPPILLKGFNPEKFRNHEVLNLDNEKFVLLVKKK